MFTFSISLLLVGCEKTVKGRNGTSGTTLPMSAALCLVALALAPERSSSATAPTLVNATATTKQLYCGTTTSFWCDLSWTKAGRFFVYFVQPPSSGFGIVAQGFDNGKDQLDQVFYGDSATTYYTACCSGANCLWGQPSRWNYANVSDCPSSPAGSYLTFDVSAAGKAVVITNPQGRGPQ
jgi:hypothetical protein